MMKKQTTLSIIVAAALLLSGTSLIATEGYDYTNYGRLSGISMWGVTYGDSAGAGGGTHNTMIGQWAGKQNSSNFNVYVGYYSGYGNSSSGTCNVAVGNETNWDGYGSYNTMLGYKSGRQSNASNSVYLGSNVGYYNTRSHTLMIDNSSTTTPLIYGEFDNDMLRINGAMEINSTKITVNPGHDVYPAIKLGGNDVSTDEMDWNIGISKPTGKQSFYIRNNAQNETPFIISSGAQNNALVIGSEEEDKESNIGIGTDTPASKLHVSDEIDSSAQVVTELLALSLDNSDSSGFSDTGFKLTNIKEGVSWTFRTLEEDSLMGSVRNGFAISKKDSGKKEMVLTSVDSVGGMELILGNGAKNTSGNWVNASSRSLKENIETLDTKAAVAAFSKLQPVTYNYKTNKEEKFVGFIAEDVPELVAMNSRDGLNPMDMVAVLTKVVQEIRTEAKAEMKAKDEKIAMMEAKIAKLETMQKRLVQVESLLTNLVLDTSNTSKAKVSMK